MMFNDHAVINSNWTGSDINYNLIDDQNEGSDGKAVYWRAGGGAQAKTYTFTQWQGQAQPGGGYPDQNSDGSGNYSTDANYPDFVDNQTDGSGDYHIKVTSPAIDGSVQDLVVYDVDYELRGALTDIGADEISGEGDVSPPAPPSGVVITK